jgi:hypothetical protein
LNLESRRAKKCQKFVELKKRLSLNITMKYAYSGAALLLLGTATADVYMHNPRGKFPSTTVLPNELNFTS